MHSFDDFVAGCLATILIHQDPRPAISDLLMLDFRQLSLIRGALSMIRKGAARVSRQQNLRRRKAESRRHVSGSQEIFRGGFARRHLA